MIESSLPRVLDEFLNYIFTVKKRSENTINAYKVDLSIFFKYLKLRVYSTTHKGLDDIDISDININFIKRIKESDLNEFIDFLTLKRSNGIDSKARKISSIKSFYRYLCETGQIEKNIVAKFEVQRIEKRTPLYLSLKESEVLLKSVTSDEIFYKRDRCILTFFLHLGIRLSELCGINISDINYNIAIKTITIEVLGKGNKKRVIPLNNTCIEILVEYLNYRKSLSHFIEENSLDALFISSKNCRINKRSVERIVKKYLQKADLDYKRINPCKLRHTAATLMYNHGNKDIFALQEILGHVSSETTKIYTHANINTKEMIDLNPLNKKKRMNSKIVKMVR